MDGGSRDLGRLELRVMATQESISGKTSKAADFEQSGFGSSESGFRGVLAGRFGADFPRGENLVCDWTEADVYSRWRAGQKNSIRLKRKEIRKKKTITRSSRVKSRILRQVASEVKAAKGGRAAEVGYSKGDFLSGVFVKE